MATAWKKVLLEGVDLTGSDVTGNDKDLVVGAGLSLNGTAATSASTQESNNVLLGADGDVTIAIDIANQTNLGNGVASGDLVLVADINDSNKIKRTSVADIVGAVSTGVTSFTISDGTTTSGNDTGAVDIVLSGSNGITTNIPTEDGNTLTISGVDATVSAKGVASFSSSDFSVTAGAVAIKDLGVSNAQLAGSIADSKLSTISTTNKVAASAVAISSATALAGSLAGTDVVLGHDADGAGHGNRQISLTQIDTFVGSNSASVGTVHDGITGATSIDGSGISYIQDLTFDSYGHVTGATAATIQDASASVAGVVSTGTQAFAGAKTFQGAVTMEGNLTVGGTLSVQTIDYNTTVATNLEIGDYTVLLGSEVTSGVADTAFAGAGLVFNTSPITGYTGDAAITWQDDSAAPTFSEFLMTKSGSSATGAASSYIAGMVATDVTSDTNDYGIGTFAWHSGALYIQTSS